MKQQAELTIKKVCPEFDGWPDSWAMTSEDKPYGCELLNAFAPFCQHLIASGLTRKTIRRHMGYLWLLGGELIEEINEREESRGKPAMQLIMDNIDDEGGPYSRHFESEAEMRSFDATCRKFYKFLKQSSAGKAENASENK